ncbi:substrate-binding periplasmic protein [Microscilla marina]|uniref:Solute-binding protein family 3/N-terminal domain-containing protein n=1 Tax=Microscilla marina ATCC 23134 TaxID=313606 RepID=A1ZT37_MICM2|nr:transporter substrate-binding domain-containing protein [Microscilla marina]EAY26427.1 hypothetical protein M23134_07022 [Microscilla marina ATCC 23134]
MFYNLQIKIWVLVLTALAYTPRLKAQTQLVGDTWAKVNQSKSGTIVLTYIDTPGLVYRDANGKLTGVCIDIVQQFVKYLKTTRGVKQLSIRVKGRSDHFPIFLRNVKQGKGGVFGLGNITITPKRRKQFKFTPAFIYNVSVLMTHHKVPTLGNLKNMRRDFAHMKAYTLRSSTNAKTIERFKQLYHPNLRIIYLSSSVEVLRKVASDPRSFTSLDFNYYASALQRGLPIKRHSVGDQKGGEEFGMIMPPTSDWQGVWNQFLSRFVRTTAYKKILVKHLGSGAYRLLNVSK